MLRRKRGTGCIRKLRGNRSKPWQVIISHKKVSGKRTRINLGTFDSYESARQYLDTYNKSNSKLKDITLEALFAKYCQYAKHVIENYTIKRYKACFAAVKELHQKKVSTITQKDLARIFRLGESESFYDKGKIIKWSKDFYIRLKSFFNNIFDYGIDHLHLSKNISRELSLRQYLALKI